MKRLILFDIDGTLTAYPVGHIEAHAVAFQKVFGVLGSIYMVDYQGQPDIKIDKDVLLHCGIPEAEIDQKLSEFFDVMGEYYDVVRQYIQPSVLPGVVATLDTLGADQDNLLGIVTGNLERIAHGKLESAGIRDHFKLGGFGNESYERADLVTNAIQKATEQHNFTPDAVYILGDTPQDIQAGLAAGVQTIGVATGSYTAEALAEIGARHTLADLTDITQLKQALGYSEPADLSTTSHKITHLL